MAAPSSKLVSFGLGKERGRGREEGGGKKNAYRLDLTR